MVDNDYWGFLNAEQSTAFIARGSCLFSGCLGYFLVFLFIIIFVFFTAEILFQFVK